MKKSIICSLMLCALYLTACTNEESVGEKAFVDLGLPSGTLWCNQNEINGNDTYGLYTYNQAVREFGTEKIPTSSNWKELFNNCTRKWTGKGYKLTGPNGKSIYLPASGYREWNGNMAYPVGVGGLYWANGTFGTGYAYGIRFTEHTVNTEAGMSDNYLKDSGGSVRLIQHK